jgi:hypothetical protein
MNVATYMSIEEIKRAYNNKEYQYDIKIPPTLANTYVFDENLTIKENKKKIEEHNAEIERLKKEKFAKNAELSRKLTNDVIEYLMGEYGFTRKQAEKVQNYIYTEKHAFMYDYFSAVDDIATFVSEVLEIKE